MQTTKEKLTLVCTKHLYIQNNKTIAVEWKKYHWTTSPTTTVCRLKVELQCNYMMQIFFIDIFK